METKFKIEVLDKDHFWVRWENNEYLVNIPDILFQIQKLHDAATAHWVSTAFTIVQNEIDGYGWFKPKHL